jgi:hypothetical protein
MTAAAKLKPCAGICGRVLDLTDFTRDASRAGGRGNMCRECRPLRFLIKTRQRANECREDTTREMTFKEIGDELGLTAQRVQQIEATALRKLRINSVAMRTILRLLS